MASKRSNIIANHSSKFGKGSGNTPGEKRTPLDTLDTTTKPRKSTGIFQEWDKEGK